MSETCKHYFDYDGLGKWSCRNCGEQKLTNEFGPKTVTVTTEVEVPYVAQCVNCGAGDVDHDACHNVNTEYVYECADCGHNWYINEGSDKIWVSNQGTKPSRENQREQIKNLLEADYYNVSLRGTMWKTSEGNYGDAKVIASVLCEKNGVYNVVSEYLNETYDTMDKATDALLNKLLLAAGSL